MASEVGLFLVGFGLVLWLDKIYEKHLQRKRESQGPRRELRRGHTRTSRILRAEEACLGGKRFLGDVEKLAGQIESFLIFIMFFLPTVTVLEEPRKFARCKTWPNSNSRSSKVS